MKLDLKNFLIVILLVVFLAGCIPGFEGPGRRGQTIGGNTGIKVSLEEYPREIFEGRSFYVTVSLENPTTELISGDLILYDEDDDLFGGIPTIGDSQPFNLKPAEVIEGNVYPDAPEIKEFGPYSYESNDRISLKNNLDRTSIKAKVRYDNYPVEINLPICVEGREKGGCRTDPVGRVTNLGKVANIAPVTIKSIDKSIAPGEGDSLSLYMDLLLVNQGGGKINNDDEDVDFSIGLVSSGNLFRCKPEEGRISLRRPRMEKIIKCIADIEVEEDYRNDYLRINLNYPYEFEVDTVQIPIVPEFLEND